MDIIKIGGGAGINRSGIVRGLRDWKQPFLIVHGANALRSQLAEKMGCPIQYYTSLSGAQSTRSDAAAIDVMMMAYAGLQNKRLVELCQQNGINAIGLSGLDGGLIRGRRKQALKVRDGEKIKIVRDDRSGRPKEINVNLLTMLMEAGYTPVLSVPILSEDNEAINTQNDSICALLVEALGVQRLVDFFEAPGLLTDFPDETSLLRELPVSDLEMAQERYTSGMMARKMMGVREAFERGVGEVYFADGRVENPIANLELGHCTRIF